MYTYNIYIDYIFIIFTFIYIMHKGMNQGTNQGIKEEEFEKFLHELFEEIYRKYGNRLIYRSKL